MEGNGSKTTSCMVWLHLLLTAGNGLWERQPFAPKSHVGRSHVDWVSQVLTFKNEKHKYDKQVLENSWIMQIHSSQVVKTSCSSLLCIHSPANPSLLLYSILWNSLGASMVNPILKSALSSPCPCVHSLFCRKFVRLTEWEIPAQEVCHSLQPIPILCHKADPRSKLGLYECKVMIWIKNLDWQDALWRILVQSEAHISLQCGDISL